jgi:hypothetical protein
MGCCWVSPWICVSQQLQNIYIDFWCLPNNFYFAIGNTMLTSQWSQLNLLLETWQDAMVSSNYVYVMHFPAYQLCIGRTWPTVGGCKPCLTNGNYLMLLAPAPPLPLISFFPHAPYPTSPNPNILQGTPIPPPQQSPLSYQGSIKPQCT